MVDYEVENVRQSNRLEAMRVQAGYRTEDRIAAAAFDADAERVKGENERNFALLMHSLEDEKGAIEFKYKELEAMLGVRVNALNTFIAQMDSFNRWLWNQEDQLRKFELEIAHKRVDDQINTKADWRGHDIHTEQENQRHRHELERISHETDEEIRKARELSGIEAQNEQQQAEALEAKIREARSKINRGKGMPDLKVVTKDE